MEDKILNYFFEKTSEDVIQYSIYEFITQESRAKGIDCQLIDTFDLIQGNSSLKGDGPVKYEKDFQKNGNGFLLGLSEPRKISFEIYYKLPLWFEDQITRQISASVIICGAEEVSVLNDD